MSVTEENYVLNIVLHSVVSIFLLIYCLIVGIVKLLVPYKYRSKNIRDEIVLVTGAGSGIGKLLSKKLAKLGARLVLIDIDQKANEKTEKEILEDGGNACSYTCDLSKRDEIYKVADEIKKSVGDVQILVNNAGIVTGKKFLDTPDNLIEKTFQVNTFAHFWLAKAFLPTMIEKDHGHIVTVASVAGLFGGANLCDYSSSKFAAVGFDESLRYELSLLNKTHVQTTLVCPYLINTGMFEGSSSRILDFLEPDYVAEKMLEAILTNQKVLFLPRFFYFLYIFRGFMPIEVGNYLSEKVFSANHMMDNFVGRKKSTNKK